MTTRSAGMSGGVVLMALGIMLITGGCVTKETYTQQVNRTTNLQRLLAEEEKRSSDLTAEVARLKRQMGEMEAENKLLQDQLKDARAQVVRSLEEVGRLQEEVQSRRASKPKHGAPAATEPPDRLDELQFNEPRTNKKEARGTPRSSSTKGAAYHDVKRGDTLFNIAKRYNTDVNTLKELNGLTGNEIHLGERLIVRKE
jgi:cell division protein FtsB